MSIFKNFRHLLDLENKPKVLSQLGVSHLLELQKLPERFKKEIEIVENKETKIVKVIDEEVLVDFLDQHVESEGQTILIKDLPLSEMKKHIREAQGVFDPEVEDPDELLNDPNTIDIKPGEFEPECDSTPISPDGDKFGGVLANLSSLVTLLHETRKQIQNIDITDLETLNEDEKQKLKKYLTEGKLSSESFLVQTIGALDEL